MKSEVLNRLNVLSGNSGEAEIRETLVSKKLWQETEIFYPFLTSHRTGWCFITLETEFVNTGEEKRGGFLKIPFISFAILTNLWFTVWVGGNNLVAFNCVFSSV